jgi:cilia- and flagella-associated protein 57
MRNQITEQSIQIGMQKSKIKSFKDDVYQAVQYIQDYKKLSEEVEKLKNKYAKDHVKTLDIDLDIHSEYISQRNYLEKSVAMLKKNLQKDNEIHKQDNRRIMRENVELIKKINQLRRENRDIKRTIKGVEKSPDGREAETQSSDSLDKLIAEKKKFLGNE